MPVGLTDAEIDRAVRGHKEAAKRLPWMLAAYLVAPLAFSITLWYQLIKRITRLLRRDPK